ncbi:thermonuclease family protein [Pararhizobium mangrovi]|nr:thermonuclease family protein [Pararhizobium mangrovi]
MAHSDLIAGPVEAQLVRVVDGDTVLVDAEPWPQQRVRVAVRLRGVDTPELHASCASERKAAERAKHAVRRLLGESDHVRLTDIAGGKYFGRVLANVETANGKDLSRTLLGKKLAVRYQGGRRAEWTCSRNG